MRLSATLAPAVIASAREVWEKPFPCLFDLQSSQTEINDLDVAVFRDRDVGGLEVSMNDAPIMGAG